MDLFKEEDVSQPLAYRMCPRNLEEYVGQTHILGQGKLLRRTIEADRITSLIFYGPPGTGKTALARIITEKTKAHFEWLNASTIGLDEIRKVIQQAKLRKAKGIKTPVFLLAWLRFALAAVAMLPWTLPLRGLRPQLRSLFLQSFFGNFLFSICMLYGISLTTATAAGVILATLPAVVALLSWLLLREPLTWRSLLAITLAVGGIALLQFARPDGGTSHDAALLGNLLMFGAVVSEATYVIVAKRLAATRAPLRVSALVNLWGLALITPFGLVQLAHSDLGTVTLPLWALLVFYALAASLFAVWMWVAGLKHVPANQAGVDEALHWAQRASHNVPDGRVALRKPPQEFFIGDVVRLIDGPLAPFGDVVELEHRVKTERRHAGLFELFLEVRNAASAIVDRTSLADLVERNRRVLAARGTLVSKP